MEGRCEEVVSGRLKQSSKKEKSTCRRKHMMNPIAFIPVEFLDFRCQPSPCPTWFAGSRRKQEEARVTNMNSIRCGRSLGYQEREMRRHVKGLWFGNGNKSGWMKR
ncbi:hypothetical protein VTH06DRAFT_6641 [Thermothelomyces fergusii]